MTSNPIIFQGAIAEDDAYDEQLRELLPEVADPKDVFLELACRDIRAACDELLSAWDHGAGMNGWVSLEVDPAARLPLRSHAAARDGRPPEPLREDSGDQARAAGDRETIAREIPVNVTLLFSLERHREVGDAYLRGLRRLREAGGDRRRVASVASFFVSRAESPTPGWLIRPTRRYSGQTWSELAREGASTQRCLWASTSTKDPSLRDVRCVEALIGPETIDTMPRETVAAFLDHGEIASNRTLKTPARRWRPSNRRASSSVRSSFNSTG